MENEFKKGEYIRTKKGHIDRITGDSYKYVVRGNATYPKIDIAKHSPNLKDLIEVDDICIMSYNGIVFQKFVSRDDIVALKLKEYKLLEILTKEQFESISYKV